MRVFKQLPILLVLMSCTFIATAQTKTDKITKEFTFDKKAAENVVVVENIFGSITVETHNSDKVQFEVERIIKAETEAGLKKAEELTLEFSEAGDSIISYLKAPYIQTKRTNAGRGTNVQINGPLGYSFKYNFRIKVPQHTNLIVRTVNDGAIIINDLVAKHITAANVNGPITLKNIAADVNARTVNGDVRVTYQKNPTGHSSLETLNGNVELLYKDKLSAIISFSTFNGDFYTDLDDLQKLPVKVEKTKSENGARTKYEIDKASSYKTGGGAASLDLKTFNGKVIVKSAG